MGFSSGILPASVYKKTIFGHWEEKEKYSVPTWVAKNAIGRAIFQFKLLLPDGNSLNVS